MTLPEGRGARPDRRVPTITGVEFFQFSAKHHNASRNWLLLKLLTDQPGLHGLGDASPTEGGSPHPLPDPRPRPGLRA